MKTAIPVLRRLEEGDFPVIRDLVEREFGRVDEAEAVRDAVAAALAGTSDEHRAIAAESDGELIGVAVYGPVAGTVGTAKLHAIMVTAAARLRGVAAQLCDAVARELARDGARLLVAEVTDTTAMQPVARLLERCGWREEGRVEDFFAESVALRLYRRDLVRGAT